MALKLHSRLEELEDILDINKLIALNNELKSPFQMSNKKHPNHQISSVWFESGNYLENLGKHSMAEICFFMAYLYDKRNPEKLQGLILSLSKNEKYNQSIEHLGALFQLTHENDSTIFQQTLTLILPQGTVNNIIHTCDMEPLEKVIEEFHLDDTSYMTWLCLSHCLMDFGEDILANQALDNALALTSNYMEF